MKIKVLLVEDSPMIVKGLIYTLEQEQFEVTTAMSYAMVRDILDEGKDFDIAILDACVIIGLNQRKPYKSRVAGLSPIILDRKIGTLTLPDDYLCSAA